MTSMRRVATWIAGLFTVMLLGSCAGPRYMDMDSTLPALQPGQGRIVLYTVLDGSNGTLPAKQPKVRINQEVVGRAKPGSFFYIDRPAGSYVVTDKIWTSGGVSFMLNPGETRYVRFAAISQGNNSAGLQIQLVDSQAEAQQQLLTLRYWGAASSARVQ